MTLLDETAALAAIRMLLADATHARLAVAFWGKGAIERLGLDRPGLTAEILCNLESGACNPNELRRLYDHPRITLRSHPALHAKVWWTSGGAVHGSSNASANGLAVEDEAAGGWHEANVALGLPVDARTYESAADMLSHFNINSIRLLSNNQEKCIALQALGITIHQQVPLLTTPTTENLKYLQTKSVKLGHLIPDL